MRQHRKRPPCPRRPYERSILSKFQPLKDVPTPGLYTVDDVAKFLKMNKKQFIKTLFFLADGEPVMALVAATTNLTKISFAAPWAFPGLKKRRRKLRSHSRVSGGLCRSH